jgi:hypothetical protein
MACQCLTAFIVKFILEYPASLIGLLKVIPKKMSDLHFSNFYKLLTCDIRHLTVLWGMGLESRGLPKAISVFQLQLSARNKCRNPSENHQRFGLKLSLCIATFSQHIGICIYIVATSMHFTDAIMHTCTIAACILTNKYSHSYSLGHCCYFSQS